MEEYQWLFISILIGLTIHYLYVKMNIVLKNKRRNIYEKFPILESAPDKDTIIRPHNLVKKMDIPERCVITFFADEMKKIESCIEL